MMLDTADNKIYFPRFYDIDTICSYDNSGQLKFDVDIEMEQGYWNTSSSRLWTRIRDLMHNDIVTTYNNMRQNGVSYENMMKYIYDEQIAKIPQTYYNKDYDVKYAPFADSYIGMAHGDTYEHVKRWLKQRFTFVDTLFDYAPSYNNDVLTIRANTTELMTLEIETYTPVYQHLSWYNGQMDKKKIDGKVSVEFSGTAQAATDQEVLIYGGSNVKSIKGITSMNPNRMLIGSATKLVEIDAHDCPLLADINANKANLSPHEYLNKVNLSNCPLLEGNLRLNNSPLIQELDIRGTKITGMNLPSSIRNLQVLKLPNTMTELTLNDAGMLHTLEFDEGVNLQSISMTNCNALENVIGLDLLQTPSITLNNSYNTVAELYFKDTTNLSLSNMANLERVIFTPNNEYETFELVNVANAPDYKVTTFNCPKLSTFMTTAPYRESYNNGDYGDIQPNTTFTANSIDISNTQFTDVKLLCTTDTNTLKLPTTVKNFYCDSSFDLDTNYLEDGEYDVVHGELVEQYTTDYEGEVYRMQKKKIVISSIGESGYYIDNSNVQNTDTNYWTTDFIRVRGGDNLHVCNLCDGNLPTRFIVNTYDRNKVFISNLVNFYMYDYEQTFTLNDDVMYIRMSANYGTSYATINEYITPNLIPSSADGSLIFSMYAPSNAVAPASGTWDLKGLEFDNFHTFGMNNDVRGGAELTELTVGSYREVFDAEDFTVDVEFSHSKSGMISDGYDLEITYKYNTYKFKFIGVGVIQDANGNRFYDLSTWDWDYVYSNMYDTTTMFTMKFSKDILTIYHGDRNYVTSFNIEDFPIHSSKDYQSAVSAYMFTNGIKYKYVKYYTYLPISMPARYDDYNITIKNVNISPKTHNTMLYPLLVNEDNPITGTLDYTNYAGKHLSWSFAYTDEEYVDIIQPKDELLNSYEYRYNAFYQTDYEFDNPYEVARYTSSASGVLPAFNSEFTYTYDEINNGDGTYTTKVYADSLDNLPTKISFTSNNNLLTVDKLNTSKVTTMFQMFRSCQNLTHINCELDTSSITNEISQMFNGCSNLEYVNVTNLVKSNIKYAAALFGYCTKLVQIEGLNTWDTSELTSLTSMFFGCSSLTSLDLSSFDTTNVTTMNEMFKSCTGLTSLDVSNFDTSNVVDMQSMFYGCSKLTSLDVSNFDTSKVTDMSSMFAGCSQLTSLDLRGFKTSEVTTMSYMFQNCYKLTSLDLSGFDTGKVATMNEMFNNCNSLTSLDLSGFDTSKVTNMGRMFIGCSALTSLHVESWSLDNVNTIIPQLSVSPSTSTLYGAVIINESTLPSGWVYKFNNILEIARYTASASGVVPTFNNGFTGYNVNEIDNNNNTYTVSIMTDSVDNLPTSISFSGKTTLLTVDKLNTNNVTVMSDMFQGCKNLTSLDVSNFNTAKVTKMDYMFQNCFNLASLDVSVFDTTNVTDISNIFNGCQSLTSLDVSGFNTAKVTKMSSMFYGCESLTSLDVSNFNTAKASKMDYMFYGCSGLTTLDLSSFNTANVSDMSYMFYDCKNLTSLDVSNFNTAKVTKMSRMFYGCKNLTSLDVSNFNTAEVTDMNYMFYDCSGLTSLNLSGFDTAKVTDMTRMFSGCSGLTSLNLSGFDTGRVTKMSSMFKTCSGLTELDSMQNISTNLDLSTTKLDATSLLDVIDNLVSLKVVVNEVNCTLIESGGTDMETGEIKSGTSCVSDETFYEVYAGKTYEINTNGSWLYVSYYYTNNKAFRGSLYRGADNTNDSCIVTPSENGYIRVSAVKAPNANTTITIKECILNPKTLTLGSTLLAKLTEDQIAIAVNKGWTVA